VFIAILSGKMAVRNRGRIAEKPARGQGVVDREGFEHLIACRE
jgi:hypothetical protein